MNIGKIYGDLEVFQTEANCPAAPSRELADALDAMVSGGSDTDAEILQVAAEFLRGDLRALRGRLQDEVSD